MIRGRLTELLGQNGESVSEQNERKFGSVNKIVYNHENEDATIYRNNVKIGVAKSIHSIEINGLELMNWNVKQGGVITILVFDDFPELTQKGEKLIVA